MVGAFFVLLVLWLFISQWLRVTVFVSAIMVLAGYQPAAALLHLMACRSADHGSSHAGGNNRWNHNSRGIHQRCRQRRYPTADRTANLG